jgi:hypothetical protein
MIIQDPIRGLRPPLFNAASAQSISGRGMPLYVSRFDGTPTTGFGEVRSLAVPPLKLGGDVLEGLVVVVGSRLSDVAESVAGSARAADRLVGGSTAGFEVRDDGQLTAPVMILEKNKSNGC